MVNDKNMNNSKKILVITPQYSPDLGPSAPIYTALCEDLVQRGYDVTVVCGFPHYGRKCHLPEYKGKFFNLEIRHGVRILRVFVLLHRGKMYRRLIYHLVYNILATLSAFAVGKPDVIIVDAPALWSGMPVLIRAVLPKVPYIYVVHDIYPDVAIHLGLIPRGRISNLVARIENFFYDRAGAISVLAEVFKRNLEQKGVPENKIDIIPACTDTETIKPQEGENKFRIDWNLTDKFIVLYTANIGLPQGLENLVKAADILRSHKNIAVVLVGEGAAKPRLQNMASDLNLENVYFFPLQPREDVPLVFGLADVSLVSLKRGIVTDSVPSKTYSIMASGRPIIAAVTEGTEIAQLIRKAECGIVIPPEDPRALADTILMLYRDRSLCKDLGSHGRRYVIENYGRSVASEKYHHLIQDLIK